MTAVQPRSFSTFSTPAWSRISPVDDRQRLPAYPLDTFQRRAAAVGKVIENHNLLAGIEKLDTGVRPDISGAAGDQNHGVLLAVLTRPITWPMGDLASDVNNRGLNVGRSRRNNGPDMGGSRPLAAAKIPLWPRFWRERRLLLLYLAVSFQHPLETGVQRLGDVGPLFETGKHHRRRLDGGESVAARLAAQLARSATAAPGQG